MLLMAFLPQGWGDEVAQAQETQQRQILRDGEYLFLHKAVESITTRKGPAIVIRHKILEAKAITAGVEPSPINTDWGYFLPGYGDAAVMQKPNVKAYALGLLGIDPSKVKDAEGQRQLGLTIQAMGDERQMARGMLVRGVTFKTVTKAEEDFTGVNWYPVIGDTNSKAEIARRRAELDREQPAPPSQVQSPTPPTIPSVPSVPPIPPQITDAQRALWLQQGWQKHKDAAPDPRGGAWWYNVNLPTGQNIRTEMDLAQIIR